MRRFDLLIAALVLVLVVYAVVRQLGSRPDDPNAGSAAIAIGETLPPDIALEALDGTTVRLNARLGTKGTVLYSWSTTCPCIPYCEENMRKLYARFSPEKGYAWFGIAGEPTETHEGIRQELTRLKSFYPMLLDPTHALCKPLGFDRAAMVVVLDGEGRLRFRGNLGDDLRNPSKIWLQGALEAIDAGRDPDPAETELAYGCEFSAPREEKAVTPPAKP